MGSPHFFSKFFFFPFFLSQILYGFFRMVSLKKFLGLVGVFQFSRGPKKYKQDFFFFFFFQEFFFKNKGGKVGAKKGPIFSFFKGVPSSILTFFPFSKGFF